MPIVVAAASVPQRSAVRVAGVAEMDNFAATARPNRSWLNLLVFLAIVMLFFKFVACPLAKLV